MFITAQVRNLALTGKVAPTNAAAFCGHTSVGAARTAIRVVSPARPRDTRIVETPRVEYTHSNTQQAPSTKEMKI